MHLKTDIGAQETEEEEEATRAEGTSREQGGKEGRRLTGNNWQADTQTDHYGEASSEDQVCWVWV